MDIQQIRNLRDTIDGELNRVTVSNDEKEVLRMHCYLVNNVIKYVDANVNRIQGNLKTEHIQGGNIKL